MNLFKDIPGAPQGEEQVTRLLEESGVRIERIVSTGQSSPEGFWYDQAWDEWVVVLQGTGVVTLRGGERKTLSAGDSLFLPAHRQHRVDATSVQPPCIWLAVHIHRLP